MRFKQLFREEFLVERLSLKSMAIASLTFFKKKRIDILLDIYDNTVKRYIEAVIKNNILTVSKLPIIRLTMKSTSMPQETIDIAVSDLPAQLLQQLDHVLEKNIDLAKNIETKYAENNVNYVMGLIMNYFSNNPKEALEVIN